MLISLQYVRHILGSDEYWRLRQKTIQSQGYRRFVVESATAQRPTMSLICKCSPNHLVKSVECFFEVNVVVLSPQAILQSLTSTTCCSVTSLFASIQVVRVTIVSLRFLTSGIWETLSFHRNLCPQECTIRHLSEHTGALVLLLSPRKGWEPGQKLFPLSLEQQIRTLRRAWSRIPQKRKAGCFNLLL